MRSPNTENQPLVLLIEDDALVRRMIASTLRRSGVNVCSCDGAECAAARKTPLEMLDGRVPDVGVIDWNLDGGDAAELLLTLDELYPNTPLLVYSADGRSGSKTRAEQAGAWRWVDKAQGGALLLSSLTEALKEGQRRSTGEGLRTLPEIERFAIVSAVRRFGSIKQASASLDMPLSTLYARLAQYGVAG